MRRNLLNPRVLLKYLLTRVRCIPNYCHRCGHDAEPFHVPDKMWYRIAEIHEYEILCLRCFHRMTRRAGASVEWRIAYWRTRRARWTKTS